MLSGGKVFKAGLAAQPQKQKHRPETTSIRTNSDESSLTNENSKKKSRLVNDVDSSHEKGIIPLFEFTGAISDVVRYWVHVCRYPSVLFSDISLWDKPVTLNSGVVQIYSNFSDFSNRLHIAEKTKRAELMDEGIDLQAPIEGGISFEDVYPENETESTSTKAPTSVVDRSGPYDSSLNLKITTADVQKTDSHVITQKVFWDVTKYLLSTRKHNQLHGVVVHQTKVELPNRYDTTMLVRTLGQRIFNLTQPLQPELHDLPTAYANPLHYQLFLVITPNMRKSTIQEECILSLYNTTASGGVHDVNSQLTLVRWGDLGKQPAWDHPLFQQACWRDLVFKVAALASYRSLYINFNFHVGHHYQYLDIFEQAFELVRREEIPHVDGSHQGGFKALWKSTLEADDVESGLSPHWIYEFDVPSTSTSSQRGNQNVINDDLRGNLNRVLPTYKGMRVRFVFRRDYTTWFF